MKALYRINNQPRLLTFLNLFYSMIPQCVLNDFAMMVDGKANKSRLRISFQDTKNKMFFKNLMSVKVRKTCENISACEKVRNN